MGSLDGKVALISGAARGMGRSHALRLAEEGAAIIALDVCAELDSVPYPGATPEDLESTVAAVEEAGGRIVSAVADVRDAEATAAAIGAGVEQLGRLDIVVANAGILSSYPAEEMPQRAWDEMIDTNLTGVWNLIRPSIRPLIDAGGGSIAIISSSAALIGLPHLPHYSAAKAGLIGLMQSLAVELGPHRIRVNTIHPTGVNTPMVQNESTYELLSGGTATEVNPDDPPVAVAEALSAKHALPLMWIEPVDVSNAVVFLASESGRHVSGTQLRVDAGSAAK